MRRLLAIFLLTATPALADMASLTNDQVKAMYDICKQYKRVPSRVAPNWEGYHYRIPECDGVDGEWQKRAPQSAPAPVQHVPSDSEQWLHNMLGDGKTAQ